MSCSANQGRLQGWRQFRKESLTKDDPHPFWYCLVKAIEQWIANPSTIFESNLSQYAPHLREPIATAVASQNTIGWENALRGFLSWDWRTLVSLDLYNSKTHAMDKADARLRKAMNSLYDYSRTTWEHRNELLHTQASNALATTIRSATAAEIKHYHSQPHLLRYNNRHLCSQSLTNLLNGRESSQRRWLRMVKKSIGIVKYHERSQTTITSFFARKP